MTDRKHDRPPTPARQPDGDEIAPAEAEKAGEIDHRGRRKAVGSLLSPGIAPAGAGALMEADSRLDDRSETEEALERAKGTPD